MTSRRVLAASALAVAGSALLIIGVWLVYPPAAFIVAGGLLLALLLVDTEGAHG